MKVVKGYYKNEEWYQYVKAYNDIGLNDDGGMTQRALTEFMCDLTLGIIHVVTFVKNGQVMDDMLYVVDHYEEFELEDVPAVFGLTDPRITITMGGVDVTAEVYASGNIRIEHVKANVIVYATGN